MQQFLKLSVSADLDLQAKSDDGTRRQFSGIANSGRPFGLGAYQTVLDFDGLKVKPKIAVLIEHDAQRAAGVASLSVASDGSLRATGHLLDNEHGRFIAEAADQDFPWEMSVFVEAERYEELSIGAATQINGHAVTGPLLIMRGCTIREVSFTPVGRDAGTAALVLSDGSPFTLPVKEQLSMTVDEQKQLDDLKAKVAELEQENQELKKSKKQEQVKAKLSAAGYTQGTDGQFMGISAATMQLLLSADDPTTDAVIADLSAQLSHNKPEIPISLLSAHLEGGDGATSAKLSYATQTNREGKNYV